MKIACLKRRPRVRERVSEEPKLSGKAARAPDLIAGPSVCNSADYWELMFLLTRRTDCMQCRATLSRLLSSPLGPFCWVDGLFKLEKSCSEYAVLEMMWQCMSALRKV